MKRVSVIIPIYNTGEYLRDCLECIVNQTLEDIEIICVDDGSTDHSRRIVEEYQRKYQMIQLICQKNSGQSVARNVGLERAQGKYVYFMDSDDILIATALEELWNMSEEEQLDVLLFSGATFYENRELRQNRTDFCDRYLRKGEYPLSERGEDLVCALCNSWDYIVSTCLQFIRKDFLNEHKIRFYEGIIHEDNLFGFSVLMRAERARCVNEIYFYRRVREESVMTRREGPANLRGYFICLMEQLRISAEQEHSEEVHQAILCILRGLLYHVKRLYWSFETFEREIFLETCTSYERFVFEAILITDAEEIGRLMRNEERIQSELDEWKYQYECMSRSVSFRIGRCITCVPRKLRTSVRVFRQGGMREVIRVIREKIRRYTR